MVKNPVIFHISALCAHLSVAHCWPWNSIWMAKRVILLESLINQMSAATLVTVLAILPHYTIILHFKSHLWLPGILCSEYYHVVCGSSVKTAHFSIVQPSVALIKQWNVINSLNKCPWSWFLCAEKLKWEMEGITLCSVYKYICSQHLFVLCKPFRFTVAIWIVVIYRNRKAVNLGGATCLQKLFCMFSATYQFRILAEWLRSANTGTMSHNSHSCGRKQNSI